MEITPTELTGACLITPVRKYDERGFFARTFCSDELATHGLETEFVQHSISQSRTRATIRGLHFQKHPHAETKIVRCLRGAIWDVIVDLRPDSSTYCRWQAFELTEDNRLQLYIPKGFAHGFQTLCSDAEVQYVISSFYAPDAASGVRFNDPLLGIKWPLPAAAMSDRDRSWPDFNHDGMIRLTPA
jgi:dTDP-4-dehydrorhamnose 3,5-epimerase